MLHNKGNTIPYYGEDLVAMPLVSFMNIFNYYVIMHSSFYINFKLLRNWFYNFYYQFTTFERKNIKNYKNICDIF